MSKIEAEIASWRAQRESGSRLDDRGWAGLVADEKGFDDVYQQVRRSLDRRASGIEDVELALAVSVICLRPEGGKHSSHHSALDVIAALADIQRIVESDVIALGAAADPVLCRDIVIAWGGGWHRATIDAGSEGWDGRWLYCVLAMTHLMERAVERSLKLLAESVDRLFIPKTADPDRPGFATTVLSYAGLLAFSAITDSCECGSRKCEAQHRLSLWLPLTPDRTPFYLRAFCAQMARGDAGPKFLSKTFHYGAFYPLLREYHGLLLHEKVEFKLCHNCRSKYEGEECRCGVRDDPARTRHFIFENAFWVADHKRYEVRRRQLCRKCKNLYDIGRFDHCPLSLCGEGRMPNRDTKVQVLVQRLSSMAVLQPNHPGGESGGEDVVDGSGSDPLRADEEGGPHAAPPQEGFAAGGLPPSEGVAGDMEHLLQEGERLGVLTASAADEIRSRIGSGAASREDVRTLAVRVLFGRLLIEAEKSNELSAEEVELLKDSLFGRAGAPVDLEGQTIAVGAKLVARKGVSAGVLTPAMEPQLIALSVDSGCLEDALDRRAGVEGVVRAAMLVREAREARLLNGVHAKQCLKVAEEYTTLEALEDNSARIRAYILSALGWRIGVLDESEEWAIQDSVDNGLTSDGALADLEAAVRNEVVAGRAP